MADFLQTPQCGNYTEDQIILLPSSLEEKLLKKTLDFCGAEKKSFLYLYNLCHTGFETKAPAK